MNRNILFLFALLVASCSELPDNEMSSLPPGKYPISFTASVYDLSVSRTTGKDAWQNNDPIAVSVDGGNSSQIYKITDTATGAMEPETSSCYWQQNTGQRILAWYPSTDVTDVDISNQSGGFADFDYLTADLTADFTASAVELPFRHQMAKVKCILTAGDGITSSDISSATIQIYGYTKAAFAKGILSGNTNGWITPTGTDKETLVVPQQMQGKKFIKVTVGTNTAARDYFYTPTGSTDANLEGGKEYTYTITVKKSGLQVESVTASWNDSSITPGTPTEATFQVHLSGSHGQTLTVNGATQVESSDVYTIDNQSNTFSISYTITESNKAKGFLIAKGIGNGERSISDNTCTFTYSNIRSDIWLNYTLYAEVGYYYYNDGTCSSTYSSGSSPACIGIVFKVGAGEGDNISNYTADTFTDNEIHGYVVALRNTGGDRISWGNISNVSLHTDNTKFYGYSNTQVIKNAAGYNETNFWACYQAINYSTAAPASGTSGWYLPSLGEYNALWQVYGEIQNKFTAAGGTDMKMSWGFYWTSSKKNSNTAACVDFGAWSATKDFTNAIKTNNAYVRPVLTF